MSKLRLAVIFGGLFVALGLNVYGVVLTRSTVATLESQRDACKAQLRDCLDGESGLQHCACVAADGGTCHFQLEPNGRLSSRPGDHTNCTRPDPLEFAPPSPETKAMLDAGFLFDGEKWRRPTP